LAVEACRGALDDAGVEEAVVDGIATFAAGDSARSEHVAYALGLDGTYFNLDIAGGGNVAVFIVTQTMLAIEAGLCDYALIYRALNSRSGKRFGSIQGRVEAEGFSQFGGPHGYLVPAQWYAMWARRHMHELGTTSEDFGQVAVTFRRHAGRNPHAMARDLLTLDDYMAGRWVCDPFRIFDCALEADGAVALLLTTRDRARDLRQVPIQMLGSAEFMGSGGHTDAWPDMTRMFSANVAPRLWERSGVRSSDVDLACLYDCFSYAALCSTEDFGFCAKGDAGGFYAAGRATYGGDLVINPHGGMLSEGYLHGLNNHFEAILQLRHQAGERQVPDAELALVSGGVAAYGGALVYAPG
jgi:acetyl-CoA acetyltransferase